MKLRPPTRAVLILILAPVLILLLLGLLATSLNTAPVSHFDRSLPIDLHAVASLPLTLILLAFTWLGAIRSVVPAVVVIVVWLLLRHRRHDAILLGVAITGALILNESLKLIFRRPRPALPFSFAGIAAPAEHTFSFPSGHAFFATVLYGMLAYLALQSPASTPRRLGLLAVAMLMPLVIGLSRIYFGMHNPTDVLAGYLAGSIWLTAVILAVPVFARRAPAPTPVSRAHTRPPAPL